MRKPTFGVVQQSQLSYISKLRSWHYQYTCSYIIYNKHATGMLKPLCCLHTAKACFFQDKKLDKPLM